MLTNGQARFAMYDLLFNRPICDYPTNGCLRVAIWGEGNLRDEAFKVCFSLGQAALPLHISVAGKGATAFGDKMLDQTGDYPDLKRFAQEEGYAELSFQDAAFSALDAEKCVRELQSEFFGYIILAMEDRHLAKAIATAIAKRAHTKCLIAVSSPELTCQIIEPNAEIYAYGMETNYAELTRLAKNINFAYKMKYDERNQRVPRETADAHFEVSQKAEFSAENAQFVGADYDADSSLSCAAHIPAKLSLCKQHSTSGRSGESILSESIIMHNGIFNQLLELEHRRWVAYMATRGFRAPTPEEEQALLYQYVDGGRFNEHRDKERRIHICMCTSGKNGVTLGQDDSQWAKEPDSFPSKLDSASVRAHRLATRASNVVIQGKKQLLCKLNPHNRYHNDFKAAVEKLLNNDCNALPLYEQAKSAVAGLSYEDEALVDEIDRQLRVVKLRNARTDFVSIDAELIRFLPFCLWYRKKYQTVITVTSKIPVRDVVVPTLFCAENALFFGPEIEEDTAYQSRVNAYFFRRGNTTNTATSECACAIDNMLKYKNCNIDDIGAILSCLEKHKQAFIQGNAILNFVDGGSNKIALAVGMFLQANPATAVYYDPKKGVVSISGDPYIAAGIDNKSFSVAEIIELIGGAVKNPLNRFSCEGDREKLAEVFKEFCRRKTYFDLNKNETVQYNTWSQMNSFFQQHAKAIPVKIYTDGSFDINKCDKEVKNYCKEFDADVFSLSDMDAFLQALQENKIIANYVRKPTAQGEQVCFDYCEKQIVKVLEQANKWTHLQFSPDRGIKYYLTRLEDQAISVNEHPVIRKSKADFMDALARSAFIKDLVTDGQKYTFSFQNEHIHWLLQQQGVPYEEIIYHYARQFGHFDDVQTGVQIAWQKDTKDYNDILIEKLEAVQKRHGLCGYYIYKEASLETKAALKREENAGTDNEIDVIAVQGMTPIFISAKTNKSTENGWIYEIKSVADHFGAIPAMIVAHDCDKISNSAFVARAAQMNVSLLGLETMWDKERLQDAFRSISCGILVKPRILKEQELLKDAL